MALMHSEAVEVRNMNIRDKPPAACRRPGKGRVAPVAPVSLGSDRFRIFSTRNSKSV